MSMELLGNNIIGDIIIRSSLFLIAGLAISWLYMRRPSQAHRILLLTLLAALLFPIIQSIAWLTPLQNYVTAVEIPTPKLEIQWNADKAVSPNQFAINQLPQSTQKSNSMPSLNNPWKSASINTHDVIPSSTPQYFSTFFWVIVIWGLLSLFVSIRAIAALVHSLKIFKSLVPMHSVEIESASRRALKQLGLSNTPCFYQSNVIRCPVILCWRKIPQVVFPTAMLEDGKTHDWYGVLLHEYAHLKRGDHLAELIALLTTIAFPWNPLVWWVKNRLGCYSEQSCDDWALANGSDSAEYAETLLNLFPQPKHAFSLPAVGHRNNIERRIVRILESTSPSPFLNLRWSLSTVSLTMVLLVVCSLFQPIYASITSGNSTFDYSAWEYLQLTDAPPVLMPMVINLVESTAPDVKDSGVWNGSPQSTKLQLNIQTEEDKLKGDIIVGFFDSVDRINPPLHVRSFSQAGSHILNDIPAGEYHIGAMIYQANDLFENDWYENPSAIGVINNWPNPLRIQSDVALNVDLHLSSEMYERHRSTNVGVTIDDYFNSRRMKTEESVNPLVMIQTVDSQGAPVPYCSVVFTSKDEEGNNRFFYKVLTDRLGFGYTTKLDSYYAVSAQRYIMIYEQMIDLYQYRSDSRVYKVGEDNVIQFVWEPFPEGEGRIEGNVFDQHDDPLDGYYITLKQEKGERLNEKVDYLYMHVHIPVANPSGKFEIAGLPLGHYYGLVRALDYPLYVCDAPEQIFPEFDLVANEPFSLNVEVEKKQAYYGRMLYPNGEPLSGGSYCVWFRKYSQEEMNEHGNFFPGELFSQHLNNDGSFRVALSGTELAKVNQNFNGKIEIKDQNDNLFEVALNDLSRDAENPADIVFLNASMVEEPTSLHQ